MGWGTDEVIAAPSGGWGKDPVAEAPRAPRGASGEWAHEDPGLGAALLAKLGQGFFKEGADEAVGLLARHANVPFLSQDEAEHRATNIQRDRQHAAEEHYPKLSFATQVLGDVGSDVAAHYLGVPVTSAPYQMATGGLRGYLASESDDPADQFISGAAGTMLGYLGGEAPAAVRAMSETRLGRALADSLAGRTASKVARWPGEALDRAHISWGRGVLSGAKGLKAEEALPDDAVREGMKSVRLFGTTAGASKRLTAAREALGAEYERVVAGLRAKGVQGPKVQELADEWLAAALEKESKSLGSQVPGLYMDRADEVLSKAGPDGRLGLDQSIEITRDLQSQAKYGKFEETLLNKAKRNIASDVRRKVEGEVEGAAAASSDPELAALAEEFRPIKARMGNLISADDHAYQEANRIASRKGPGLMEMMAGLSAYGTTQNPIKTGAAMLGTHLLRTRGPSTAAVTAGGLSKAALWAVEKAPQLFGEFGAVIAGQKTPEARAAMVEDLAQRFPAFAQMLDEYNQPAAGQASLGPAQAPRQGDPLRATRKGR